MSQNNQFTTTNRQAVRRTFVEWMQEVDRIFHLNGNIGLLPKIDYVEWYKQGMPATEAAREASKRIES